MIMSEFPVSREIISAFTEFTTEAENLVLPVKARYKEFLKEEESKLNEEKKRLNEEAARIKTELGNLKTQRAELALKVDKDILKKYERIIKNRDGLAVVPVANESCQGCFRIMPPQVINEIKMKSDLIFCENCTRILYIEE